MSWDNCPNTHHQIENCLSNFGGGLGQLSIYPLPKFAGHFSNYLCHLTTYTLESCYQMDWHDWTHYCAKYRDMYINKIISILVIEGWLNPTTVGDLAVGGTITPPKFSGHFWEYLNCLSTYQQKSLIQMHQHNWGHYCAKYPDIYIIEIIEILVLEDWFDPTTSGS